MMDVFGSTQFDQLTQGLQVAGNSTDVAQSMFFVTPITSLIIMLLSYLGAVMIFLTPGVWLAKALISNVPFVNNLVGGGSSAGGMSGGSGGGFLSGIGGVVLSIALATLAVTGAWTTAVAYEVQGISFIGSKITQSSSMSSIETPQSIKQYKGLVDVYDNSEAYAQYKTLLSKESSTAEKMVKFFEQNSPSDSDSAWIRKKAGYTSIVAKLQVLSNKLESSGYAKEIAGSDDPNIFKQHLSQTKASDATTAPYKPSFISPSVAQAFGVELGTSSQ